MTTLDHLDWQEALDLLCFSTARQILAGVSFDTFRQNLEVMVSLLLSSGGVPKDRQPPEMLRSMTTLVALEVWNATPIPENRFRPRKIAKPECNGPCLCGSGAKFKQCCGVANAPELGISEELMLSKVLATFSRKRLLELPLLELSPNALAEVAHGWLEEGRPKDAIALLEKLFTHLPQLDERAEFAADMLLNAYSDANTPRKKQQFIAALQGAPDKTLRSTGWQRQTTIHSDKGDYTAAWQAFREAQRLTPNAPALSHLEVLVLVSEGRREEAKARAKFWAARLGRDRNHDYSDLIATLNDLADGSDASLLRTVPLGKGPLAELLECIKGWPAPANHYQLRGGAELKAKRGLKELEEDWQEAVADGDLDHALLILDEEPLAGQSFLILRDTITIIASLPENLPGSNDAVARLLLDRSEALRQAVLGKLKALNTELPWGFLDNRPLLTLVRFAIEDFAQARPEATLNLLRWCVNVANPTDNQGLREQLIHTLVARGLADEAITVSERYPNDFATTEYGRVLALFAAGQTEAAATALLEAYQRYPKVWKMLHAANPKRPRSRNPGYVTIGGDDEAYHYRQEHLDLWRSSGALKWGAGIKLPRANPNPPAARPSGDAGQESLF